MQISNSEKYQTKRPDHMLGPNSLAPVEGNGEELFDETHLNSVQGLIRLSARLFVRPIVPCVHG